VLDVEMWCPSTNEHAILEQTVRGLHRLLRESSVLGADRRADNASTDGQS